MEYNPFFSVIIPTYNRAVLLAKAIESVIKQSFINWELIIVDDASTDNTEYIVSLYKDSRIKYIKNSINLERSESRNKGIESSNGRYICFLDSDDYYFKDHLLAFYNKLENNKFPEGLLYCNTLEDDGLKLTALNKGPKTTHNKVEHILINIFGAPRTCIYREILLKHKFRKDYWVGEDMDLWVRIVKEYPIFYCNHNTVVYLQHDSRTVSFTNKEANYLWLKVIKNIFRNDTERLISKKVSNILFSQSYYYLAKYYEHSRNRTKMIYYFILSTRYNYKFRLKENLYTVLKNFKITNYFIVKFKQYSLKVN